MYLLDLRKTSQLRSLNSGRRGGEALLTPSRCLSGRIKYVLYFNTKKHVLLKLCCSKRAQMQISLDVTQIEALRSLDFV
jgi:hypothetical protein